MTSYLVRFICQTKTVSLRHSFWFRKCWYRCWYRDSSSPLIKSGIYALQIEMDEFFYLLISFLVAESWVRVESIPKRKKKVEYESETERNGKGNGCVRVSIYVRMHMCLVGVRDSLNGKWAEKKQKQFENSKCGGFTGMGRRKQRRILPCTLWCLHHRIPHCLKRLW